MSQPDPNTTGYPSFMRGLSAEKLLESLPMLSGVVFGSERMKGASDAELQAWANGVEDASKNLGELIDAWRKANAQP